MSNIENKIDNITKALNDFSQNQFATKVDLNRAFNELVNSLGTVADNANEKFANQFLDHIRYLIDERNRYLQDNLQDFEESIKDLANNIDSKNFSYEVKKFSNEINNVREKIEEQEHIFVNLSRSVEELYKQGTDKSDFENIREDLTALSKGFEGVTLILNKNFGNFISEVKKINNDQAFLDINSRLDGIIKTANMIVSSVNVIDHKYQDINGVIEFITDNESTLSRTISELQKTTNELNDVMPQLKVVTTKGDLIVLEDKISAINSFLDNLKSYIEASNNNLKDKATENLVFIKNKILEMQGDGSISKLEDVIKGINSKLDEITNEVKTDLTRAFTGQIVLGNENLQDKFNENFLKLQENLRDLSTGLNNLDNTLKQNIGYETRQIKEDIAKLDNNFAINITSLKESFGENIAEKVSSIKDLLATADIKNLEQIRQIVAANIADLRDIIDNKIIKNDFQEEAINSIQKEIKTLLIGVIDLKNDFKNINDNQKTSIENIIKETLIGIDESIDKNDKLKNMSKSVDLLSRKLDDIVESIQDGFNERELNSGIEILQRVNEIMPKMMFTLDESRDRILADSSNLYQEIKKHFSLTFDEIKLNIEKVIQTVKDTQTQVMQNVAQDLRRDLQDVSNNLTESVESINTSILDEFGEQKETIASLTQQIGDYEANLHSKIETIKNSVESNTYETKQLFSESLSASVVKYTEHLNVIAGDILSKMAAMDDFSNTSFTDLENRIDSMVHGLYENQANALNEEMTNFNAKLDKINWQQVHSAKELLGEVNALASIHNDASVAIKTLIQKLETKINEENGSNNLDIEQIELLETNIIQNLKEELSKQTQSFNAGFARIANLNKTKEASLAIINEQIELLSKTLTQEFKSEFQKQYQAVIAGFARITSNKDNEENENNNLSNEQIDFVVKNIAQDFKSEFQKHQQLLLEDVSRILNAPKNRDSNLQALNDRINLFTKTISQEFKSELQNQQEALVSDLLKITNSQKTEEANIASLNDRIELFSKTISQEIKTELQTQQRIIVEDLAQMASINKTTEETIFDLNEKFKGFEENISQILRNEIESQQKSFAENIRKIEDLRPTEEENQKNAEFIEQRIENVGQSILQEVRNELQSQQRILLNDLARIEKDSETKNTALASIQLKTDDILKEIEEKVFEELKNQKELFTSNINLVPKIYDKQEEIILQIETKIQSALDELENKINDAKEALNVEISNIKLPKEIDEEALKNNINENTNNAFTSIKEEISQLKEKIENVEFPEYDDSSVKASLGDIVERIDNIKMPEYNDEPIREGLRYLAEKIASIKVPEFDDSNIKEELRVISDRILDIKIPDITKDELIHELNIASDVTRQSTKDEIIRNTSLIQDEIRNIYIPTIDEEKLNNDLRNNISDIADEIKSEVRELNYDLKEDIKDVTYNVREEIGKTQDLILAEVSNLEETINADKIKNQLSSLVIEISKNIEDFKNNMASEISNIKIPKAIDEKAIKDKISEVVTDIANELRENSDIISSRINSIKIPEQIDTEELRNSITEDIKDIITSAKFEFTAISNRLSDEINNIEIPETQDNNLLKEEINNHINNSIERIQNEILNLKDSFENQINDIEIPKYDENAIKEQIKEISEQISNIKVPEFDDSNIQNSIQELKEKINLITGNLNNLDYAKPQDLEDNTDILIGIIRERIKENADNQNSILNNHFAKLEQNLSNNDSNILIQKIYEKLQKIQDKENYGLSEVEDDIRNIKIAVDRTNSIDMIKNLTAVKTLTSDNIKLNQHVEQQLSYVNNWLRGAAKAMEILAHKVDKVEKITAGNEGLSIDTEKFDNVAVNLAQKYKIQEMRLDDIGEKINALIQKQGEDIDMTSFIKVFHESVKQTNALASRIDSIENRMNSLQKSLERIVAFIES